jgi:uncharacterized metal-binding protein YceD (DUF177 family)
MEITALPEPEFSRLLAADPASAKIISEHLSASPAECAALAKRFGVEAIQDLRADCRLASLASANRLRLEVKFSAAVRQLCVITLEPVETSINAEFAREYTPPAFTEDTQEIVIDPDADDPPEAIPEGGIDAGEAVAEQLGLEIDPFPRAPGAEFEEINENEQADHPFAQLRNLKIDGE